MAQSAIERYLRIVLHERGAAYPDQHGPTVAISRDYGAGAREIAPLLAERIGVPYYDKGILEGIIQQVEGDPELMHRLDETAPPGPVERMLRGFGGIPSSDEYAKALVQVVLSITRGGGVVLGRGAHLIASVPDMYRVYLCASPDSCIARIAQRENRGLDWARGEWLRIEEARHRFLKRLFGHERDEFRDFDLIINTDRCERLQDLVDVIVSGMHARGLHNGRS